MCPLVYGQYSQELSQIFCHLLVPSRTFIQVRDPQWSAGPTSDAPPRDPSPLAGKTSQWLLPKLKSYIQHFFLTGNCENLQKIIFPLTKRKVKSSNITCCLKCGFIKLTFSPTVPVLVLKLSVSENSEYWSDTSATIRMIPQLLETH